MPSQTDEIWKYVDLDFDLADFSLPTEPGTSLGSDGATNQGHRFEIIDGLVTADTASQAGGATVTPLAQALRDDEGLESKYDGLGDIVHDKFSAAARAFGSDGAYVSIAKGVVAEDAVVLDIQSVTTQLISFPRVIIDVAEGAEASVIVEFRSDDAIDALVVPELDAAVAANATLRLTIIQNWGSGTSSLGRVRIVAARDAQVTFAEAGLGGSHARLHLAVDLEGQGSSARIVGAYFGDADQVLDYRYFMRHIGENTSSDMFLKGGVEDKALSIFTGMIRIEESAQRTNAFQTNRNLLLSPEAAAQSVPNLEILANDVKCGHGSTVGPLDEDQRYYLMSRGLDHERADRLQVRGFFEEALARFPKEAATGFIRARINAKYVEAQKEGRV